MIALFQRVFKSLNLTISLMAMPSVDLSTLIHEACSGTSIISFPTDTVPALAVRPDRAGLIFTAKQRSQDKPLILMAATPDALWPFAHGNEDELQVWQQVSDQHWPGALTLVLPASDRVPEQMHTTSLKTIGLRVPADPMARYVLAQTGPLATTSANRSGCPPLLSVEAILTEFPEVVTLSSQAWQSLALTLGSSSDLLVSTNSLEVPSTIIRWQGKGWEVLRQGAVQMNL
jgi:L-threonylcarbamoyladenylate synthase